MSDHAHAEAEEIVNEYGNIIGDTWQEGLDAIVHSGGTQQVRVEVSDEAQEAAQVFRNLLVDTLANAINVDERRQRYIATGSDSALEELYEAEHKLHESLSALRNTPREKEYVQRHVG